MIAEISGVPSSVVPVRAVTVTTEVMSVPELVMNAFAPSTTHSSAVEGGLGAGGAGVGAGVGLGQAEAGERAPGDEVGEEALLLGVGAVREDRVDAEADAGRERDADRLVDPAELLDGDAQAGERAALGVLEGAAVLLGDDEAEQPEVAHPRDEVGREVVLAVPARRRAARRPRSANSRTTLRKSSWSLLSSNICAPSAVASGARVAGTRWSVTFLTLTST